MRKQQLLANIFQRTILQNHWIPVKPTPKQARFLLQIDTLESLYGGAAGGGKSVALLMCGLQWVEFPEYNGILFRKTYTDLALPNALMDLSHKWLDGTTARWDQINHRWTFPSKATLSFGYLDYEGAEQRYRSAEFQVIGFDEVTEFSESPVVFMFSRLRKPARSNLPLLMRYATNPGGLGHQWVKQRLIVEGARYGRTFIPAFLTDNPYVDQPGYVRSLQQLDPVRRKQLLEGSWDVQLGTMFKREWFRIIEPSETPLGVRKVRFWDLASTEPEKGKDPDYTAGVLVGLKAGQYFVLDVVHFRGSPKQVEDKIKSTADVDGREVELWMEEEGGSSGKTVTDHYAREVLLGYNFHAQRSTGNKVVRAGPLSSATEARNVFLVRGNWINAFLDEFEGFPEGEHDDQVDATSGACNILASANPKPKVMHA